MKPNLIVIGAMKAGTTSFHEYLDSLPDVAMSTPKETNFFSNPKYWAKGKTWYESHFQDNARIRGESGTAYTAYPRIQGVPERIKEYLPDVKLIYLIRDPITRLISHYLHLVCLGRENRSFSDVVSSLVHSPDSPYITQSRYALQLQQYLRFFSVGQVLVLTTEQLKSDTFRTMQTVSGFLGINGQIQRDWFKDEKNRSQDKYYPTRWSDIVCPRWLREHPRLPWKVKAPFQKLARLGAESVSQVHVNDDETEALTEIFKADVVKLKEVVDVDLSRWREY